MTTHDPTSEALMLAYVYGELSEGAAQAFEAQMAEDPDLRAEVEGLLATRDLLDEDMRYGDLHGLDDPPPHLRDAIFRAEVLTRPPALRDAAVMRAAPSAESPPLLHRLSTWLLGGGVALGAAAALVVVISQGTLKSEAPRATLDLEATLDREMAAPETAAEAPAAADPSADAKALRDEVGDRAVGDDRGEAFRGGAERSKDSPHPAGKNDDRPDEVAQKREATYLPRGETEAAGAAPPPPVQQAPHQGVATPPSKSAGSTSLGRSDLDAPGALYALESKSAPAPEPSAPKVIDRYDDGAEEDRAQNREPATSGFGAADKKPSKPSSDPPASARARTKLAPRDDSPGDVAPRPNAESSRGPPALPADLREAEKERLELKAKKKGGEQRKSAKGRSLDEERQKLGGMQNEQAISDALATGNRELAHHRPAAALEAYRQARSADPRRTFGILPELGQMKAWLELGQPARALDVFAAVKKRTTLNPQGIEAYRLAAKAAEQSGRYDEAIGYWQHLSKVKAERKDALAAQTRLKRARTKAADAQVDADEPAAAEAVQE